MKEIRISGTTTITTVTTVTEESADTEKLILALGRQLARVQEKLEVIGKQLDELNGYAASDPEQVAFEERTAQAERDYRQSVLKEV